MDRPEPPEQHNEALAMHFRKIAGGRSIEKLRLDMKEAGYDIGAGTLWRLSRGEEGVRTQSLKKLAAYAGMEPDELLRIPTSRSRSPAAPGPTAPGLRFDSVTEDEHEMLMFFRGMSDEDRGELTAEMSRRAAKWAEVVKQVLAQTSAKYGSTREGGKP